VIVKGNPISLLRRWISEAELAGHPEANAFTLSTTGPSSRVVLLKALRGRVLTFFSNYLSFKGRELQKSNKVAINFYWGELHRQVRILGRAKRSPVAVSDRYFASRPRGAQLAVHAALQSAPISSRQELLDRYSETELKFRDKSIPRPINWGGYDVTIDSIEFWQGMPSRLHDRVFFKYSQSKGWVANRLAP
jgi:pyridoxamine 5'-phosphate oxidase